MQDKLSIDPMVSIIIGVYNAQDTLTSSLNSILNQTYKGIEIVIIDDASTDNSKCICEEFNREYDNVQLIQNKSNIGLTKSLNKGLKLARGKFIARCDADDLYEENKLKKQLLFFESNSKAKVCFTNFEFLGSTKNSSSLMKLFLQNHNWFLAKKILGITNLYVHGTLMIEKKKLEEIGGYNPEFYYSQDYELYLRLSKTERFYFINEPLYFLRIHEGSISLSSSLKQIGYKLLAVKKHNGLIAFYLSLLFTSIITKKSPISLFYAYRDIIYNLH